MGLTFAGYVIKPFFPSCQVPDSSVRLLAAATICKSVLHFFMVLVVKQFTVHAHHAPGNWKSLRYK